MRSRLTVLLVAAVVSTLTVRASGAPGPAKPASPAPKVVPAAAAPATESPGPKDVNACRKLPAGKRIVKLNLKPETSVGDLIAWISAVTCKQFIFPASVGADSKKVTVYAPQLMTPEDAYRLFLGALDSVGLTVYRDGAFLHVIEVGRAKTSPIPLCVGDEGGAGCPKQN